MAATNKWALANDLGLRTVLVSRFSALGDVAMTIPLLYSACECYPDIKFVMVTRPKMVGMFVNKPANLEVVGPDVKREYKGIGGIRRLAKELCEKYKPDAYIDLHDVLRTKLLRAFMRMHGVKTVKINKGRAHKRALTRRSNKVMLPQINTRQRYREAFFKVGLTLDISFQGLYGANGQGPEELYKPITPLTKQPDQYWIGIAPFAAHTGKIYPIAKMEEVVKAIDSWGNCKIFIFGAEGYEQEVAEGWQSRYPSVQSLAGKKYGFPAELSLISHLDVMLTMDSANMHLAAITGTRTVSIWGATHFYCGFKGWHQLEEDMLQVPLSCRPCSVYGDKKCYRGDYLCLNAITPETVVHKIDDVLKNERRIRHTQLDQRARQGV